MNNARVQTVMLQAPDRSLDQLEADIWAGVAARAQDRRRGAVLAGGQLMLMALALAGSLSVGSAAVGTKARQSDTFAVLSSADLAPSALLIGR